ncbi:MAG TPA: hypothetical protein VE962_02275 [Actinomycetota bacterium]|nr:hypothetical protein [Actinomycetota bacterium]
MTSIRTNCPRCGEVEMRADVILLTVEPSSGEGTYSFVCPSCEDLVEKPADQKIVSLLKSVGVDVAERAAPSPELETRPEGPAFTLDDVIDFHFLLSRDDWVGDLLASAE